MLNRGILKVVFPLGGLIFCSPLLAQKVEPGEWQITSTVASPALPKPETRVEKHCVKSENVDDPNRWMGQMAPDCQVVPGAKSADSYSWQVSCPQSGMRGSGTMRWTRTSMDIDMEMASERQGKKVELRTKVSGKRLGPCKG
jgi:hypothetical protein